MGRSQFSVQVEGLNQLKKTLRQLKDKDLSKKVREANKEAAEIVKPDAQKGVPQHTRTPKDNKRYRPGKLAKSVKVVASANSAAIKAGTSARAPYAGAIHFGFPKRGISPNRFLYRAMARNSDKVSQTYEREIAAVLRDKLES
ncbi:HK97-gp10 family putative phage morphogenesis protein [Streptomyces sp. H27-C3]|uniref:HK97-gp10 family putative phage morphogenesis protein n=1 Tax=Streptomyces sp. H27-C3 TaxID=3046305 RepID=UPI0024BAF1E1|nr:HK97-gp10 family putative phage morphogenesis protein [Streptomyces sp. H27-C3]MDJ0462011.1 HK97 gp10 family phage protein [Streptomyces sp. H27-C3]